MKTPKVSQERARAFLLEAAEQARQGETACILWRWDTIGATHYPAILDENEDRWRSAIHWLLEEYTDQYQQADEVLRRTNGCENQRCVNPNHFRWEPKFGSPEQQEENRKNLMLVLTRAAKQRKSLNQAQWYRTAGVSYRMAKPLIDDLVDGGLVERRVQANGVLRYTLSEPREGVSRGLGD